MWLLTTLNCSNLSRVGNEKRTVPSHGHQPDGLGYRLCADLWHVATCLDRFQYGHNGAFLPTHKLHPVLLPCLMPGVQPGKASSMFKAQWSVGTVEEVVLAVHCFYLLISIQGHGIAGGTSWKTVKCDALINMIIRNSHSSMCRRITTFI